MVKILIGDDDNDIRHLLATVFKMRNYNVMSAGSKKEVFQVLEIFTPDFIFLDVMFGEHDGRELCWQIKEKHSNIKIILMSAWESSLENHTIYNADHVLPKPFRVVTLYNIIENQK